MKFILVSIFFFFISGTQRVPSVPAETAGLAPVYVSKEIKTRLYSEAPIENIEATSVRGVSVLNIATGEVQFTIPISSFQFKKALMKEHFNENYMESHKYPNAAFKGKLNEKIDPDKDGNYPVAVTGEFEIHGVKQQRTITGNIKVANNQLSISAQFNVLCKDHNIKIPTLVFKNIAESIQVTVSGNFTAYLPAKS